MDTATTQPARLRSASLRLSPGEAEDIAAVSESIELASATDQEILAAAEDLIAALPQRLKDAIAGLSAGSDPATLLYVQGLHVGKVAGFSKAGKGSELLLAAVASLLGSPFTAPDHRDGSPFLDLIPIKKDKDKQLGTGTELKWHTEDAHLDEAARFICLLGLRGDESAKTLVSTLDLSAIEDNALEESLRSVRTHIRSDESYSRHVTAGTPTLTGTGKDSYRLRFDPEFTDYADPATKHTHCILERLLEESALTFSVGEGDLLIFNNYTSAHRRSDFTPTYSETDRWVQRIMVL